MIKVVLATHNSHKAREMREMLKKSMPQIDFISLHAFPDCKLPLEIEPSFEGNAQIKATYVVKHTQCFALGDDSGLVVPALGGAPGVHSARYAGTAATDKENRVKLLQAMQNLSDDQRVAYFECCLALACPNGEVKIFKGSCFGSIAEQEKGSSGFGYDSLFVKEGYHHTFAQLDEATKNRISHRSKAIDCLLPTLESIAKYAILP